MKAIYKPRIDLNNRTKLETVIPLKTPFIINVDPSDICNFQCRFCPTGDRKLMRNTLGRNHGNMDFNLYKKIIDDICEFEHPIKVLRLYKDGEPLLNPRFADMVQYAKQKGCAERIDTTTNASLLTPKLNLKIIKAGLDRINISIIGVNPEQYWDFSHYMVVDYEHLVSDIRHLYEHKEQLEIIIKINGDILTSNERKHFIKMFGDICDGISIEHIMNCWPGFDYKDVQINQDVGIYGQPIKEVLVCPYPFYSFSINSDGTVSLCFLDWNRQLIIGDTKLQSVKNIWEERYLYEYQKMFLLGLRKNHPVCGHCGQLSHGQPDDIDRHRDILLRRLDG